MQAFELRDFERTATLVSALDSPLRLQILKLLHRSPHVVHQLVAKLNKSQPLVSQHLRVLKQANLVDATRAGREVVYSLSEPAIMDTIDALSEIARLQAAREVDANAPVSVSAAIVDPPPAVAMPRDPGLVPVTPAASRD